MCILNEFKLNISGNAMIYFVFFKKSYLTKTSNEIQFALSI